MLFISGLQDDLIHPNHMKELYDICKSEDKTLFTVVNGTHNDTWHIGGKKYIKALQEFLKLK